MKKGVQFTSLMIVLILTSTISFAQEYIKMDRSNKITFEKSSKISETYVNVRDDFNYLSLNIECSLTKGKFIVEVINPDGEVKDEFTVIVKPQGNNTLGEERGFGQIDKKFRNPTVGYWLVRIKPTNASGTAKIFSTLIYNQRIDLLELEEILEDTQSNLK